jgi:hypothetical protein
MMTSVGSMSTQIATSSTYVDGLSSFQRPKEVLTMSMHHDSLHDSASRLCSPQEAAEFLGVSVDTLARWRVVGTGPAFVKFSRAKQAIVRYRREDLERFVQAHVRTSTSSP